MEGNENSKSEKESTKVKESIRLVFLHTIALSLVFLLIYVIQLLLDKLIGDDAKLFDLIPIRYITLFIGLAVLIYYVFTTSRALKEKQ